LRGDLVVARRAHATRRHDGVERDDAADRDFLEPPDWGDHLAVVPSDPVTAGLVDSPATGFELKMCRPQIEVIIVFVPAQTHGIISTSMPATTVRGRS
jgi:hypothetical protein